MTFLKKAMSYGIVLIVIGMIAGSLLAGRT